MSALCQKATKCIAENTMAQIPFDLMRCFEADQGGVHISKWFNPDFGESSLRHPLFAFCSRVFGSALCLD
jgi:hypothetical protein